MPQLIPTPRRVQAAGNKPKFVNEYVGRFANGEASVSIAHMCSPSGWIEPGQTPEFDEYTVVLSGTLQVKHRDGVINVRAGQAIHTRAGEWIQYSTPGPEGAEYLAVCLPAFSAETVHRDPPTAETSREHTAGDPIYPAESCTPCDKERVVITAGR